MSDNTQEPKLPEGERSEPVEKFQMVNKTIGSHNSITLQDAIDQGIVVPLPKSHSPIIEEPAKLPAHRLVFASDSRYSRPMQNSSDATLADAHLHRSVFANSIYIKKKNCIDRACYTFCLNYGQGCLIFISVVTCPVWCPITAVCDCLGCC